MTCQAWQSLQTSWELKGGQRLEKLRQQAEEDEKLGETDFTLVEDSE
jgi:hypothetical protein